MRKKCPYSEFLWYVFSRIQTEYEEIRMGENTDQKISKYAHFSRTDRFCHIFLVKYDAWTRW